MNRVLALLLLSSTPALAQQAAELPGDPAHWFAEKEAAGATRAPDLAALAGEAFDRARWSTTTQGCKTLTRVEPYGLQPATADRLVSEGLKAGAFVGAWTFYARTDCAETPLLRYLYIAESDGRNLLIVVNRGEAIATPSQMRETSRAAAKAAYDLARKDAPGCEVKSVAMRQTRIASADGNLSPMRFGTRFAGGWSEDWDFVACGRKATVTVRFDADGKGGAAFRVLDVSIS
jgi:hypothetical protein